MEKFITRRYVLNNEEIRAAIYYYLRDIKDQPMVEPKLVETIIQVDGAVVRFEELNDL